MTTKLIPCSACHTQISKKEKICPICGAKQKKRKWLFIGLVILAFSVISGVMEDNEESKKTPAEKRAERRAEKARGLIYSCKSLWLQRNEGTLHDPDSLDWDTLNATIYVNIVRKKVIYSAVVPFRAKNGFGALVRHETICKSTPQPMPPAELPENIEIASIKD